MGALSQASCPTSRRAVNRGTPADAEPLPGTDSGVTLPGGSAPTPPLSPGAGLQFPGSPMCSRREIRPKQRAGPAMPLAHFRLRPGASQPRPRRPLRLHSRLFAGTVAVLLGVLATGAGAATAADTAAPAKPVPAQPQPAKANDGACARVRSQRPDLRPQHAGGRDPGHRRRHCGRTGRRRNGHQAVLPAVQARHLRQRRGAADRPGGLFDGGRRPGRFPHGCHHQRARRRLQPMPDRGQLHRAEQLLALVVQPHHQRHRPRRLPEFGQLLGCLAGLPHAARQHHRRQSVPDGLLHRRTAVCQRRVHLRFQDRQRHQRFTAAVFRA